MLGSFSSADTFRTGSGSTSFDGDDGHRRNIVLRNISETILLLLLLLAPPIFLPYCFSLRWRGIRLFYYTIFVSNLEKFYLLFLHLFLFDPPAHSSFLASLDIFYLLFLLHLFLLLLPRPFSIITPFSTPFPFFTIPISFRISSPYTRREYSKVSVERLWVSLFFFGKSKESSREGTTKQDLRCNKDEKFICISR